MGLVQQALPGDSLLDLSNILATSQAPFNDNTNILEL